MLLEREDRLRAEEYVDRIKVALVTSSPSDFLYLVTGEDRPDNTINEVDLDQGFDEPGEWDFSQSSVTPEEAMKVLAGITSNIPVIASLEDLGSPNGQMIDEDDWVLEVEETELYGDDTE